MTDIPDDIRKLAEAVVDRGYNVGLIEAVAAALIKEREGLLDYAGGLQKMAKKNALEEPEDDALNQFWAGYLSCTKAFVRRIRSPNEEPASA